MPDPVRLLTTLQKAAEAFRATPGRRGRLVELQDCREVLVAGDLHGNVGNFARILRAADLARYPERHLVLQEIIHGPYRYSDGSDRSHQLLDLLAALKCQHPRQVHCLMGNHELAQWSGRAIGKRDESCNELFRAGVSFAYGEHAAAIYDAYVALLATLPLALRTPNRVFLSHSLPTAKQLAAWTPDILHKEHLDPADALPGGAAYALVWGRDASEATVAAFLETVDASLLITGHIACEGGFATPGARHLVLDADGDKGCYCIFPADRPVTLGDLVAGVRQLAGSAP